MAIELIRGLHNIKAKHQHCVVTIGNFDGIHRGHQGLFQLLKERACEQKASTLVITFEPQPNEYFLPNQPVPRLTRWREKCYWLDQIGIDYLLIIPFTPMFSNLKAENFIHLILVNLLQIKQIIVGHDFHFGHNREGNIDLLKQQKKFTTETMPSLKVEGERVSSTRIRQALKEGHQSLAERLLGRPYTMMGRVGHGNKLGRQLGFPTANIAMGRKMPPVQGIYIVRLHGIAPTPLPGVANVGIRPTIGGTRSLLEVHLFNFDRDIYGKHVTIEFCKKLRDEERYANLELLKAQIEKDAETARAYFVKRGELYE